MLRGALSERVHEHVDVKEEHRTDPSDRAAPRCYRGLRQAGAPTPGRWVATRADAAGSAGAGLAVRAAPAPAAPSAWFGPPPRGAWPRSADRRRDAPSFSYF